MDNPIEEVKQYAVGVMLRKVGTIAIKAGVGWAAGYVCGGRLEAAVAHGVAYVTPLLAKVGIGLAVTVTVDETAFKAGLALLVVSGIEVAHDYARFKFPNIVKV